MPLRADLRTFPGLSHAAFQHPLDRQALANLEKVPLLPLLTRKLSEAWFERFYRVERVSGNLRVSERQFPSLYRDLRRMAEVLDLPELPTLFLDSNPVINAFAMGIEDYYILVTTGIIELMTEEELRAVIGHELGHIKCQHMLYMTMVNILTQFGTVILDRLLPNVAQVASLAIQLALLEWYRKAEFSCDRAALLATQDPDVVCSALTKLAGWSSDVPAEFDLDEVKRQAQDYQELGADSIMDKVIKVAILMQQTHPFPVVRVAEISKWVESGEYQAILDGRYQTTAAFAPSPQPAQPEAPTGPCCPACGAAVRSGARFCSECGTDLTATPTCSGCHSPIQPDWRHCPACGRALAGPSGPVQAAEPPPPEPSAGN